MLGPDDAWPPSSRDGVGGGSTSSLTRSSRLICTAVRTASPPLTPGCAPFDSKNRIKASLWLNTDLDSGYPFGSFGLGEYLSNKYGRSGGTVDPGCRNSLVGSVGQVSASSGLR